MYHPHITFTQPADLYSVTEEFNKKSLSITKPTNALSGRRSIISEIQSSAREKSPKTRTRNDRSKSFSDDFKTKSDSGNLRDPYFERQLLTKKAYSASQLASRRQDDLVAVRKYGLYRDPSSPLSPSAISSQYRVPTTPTAATSDCPQTFLPHIDDVLLQSPQLPHKILNHERNGMDWKGRGNGTVLTMFNPLVLLKLALFQ